MKLKRHLRKCFILFGLLFALLSSLSRCYFKSFEYYQCSLRITQTRVTTYYLFYHEKRCVKSFFLYAINRATLCQGRCCQRSSWCQQWSCYAKSDQIMTNIFAMIGPRNANKCCFNQDWH